VSRGVKSGKKCDGVSKYWLGSQKDKNEMEGIEKDKIGLGITKSPPTP